MVIVDAQSVKNTDTAREKGYDGGKKVSGIKRHIGVDTNGLLHSVSVTTANVTDRDGAIIMTKQHKEILSEIEKMLVDGGYQGEKFAVAIKKITGAVVEVVKRNELHTFKGGHFRNAADWAFIDEKTDEFLKSLGFLDGSFYATVSR